MQPSAVSIVLVCLGATAILYFLYYFLIPILLSGHYLNSHYAKSKYKDGFFWVKLKDTDRDYWVYKIDISGCKIRYVCWIIYWQHKKAYEMYLGGRDDRKG